MFMNLAAVKLTKVGPKKGTKLLVVEYLKQKGDRLVVVHNAVACALVYVTTLQNDIKVESHFIMDVSSRRQTDVQVDSLHVWNPTYNSNCDTEL